MKIVQMPHSIEVYRKEGRLVSEAVLDRDLVRYLTLVRKFRSYARSGWTDSKERPGGPHHSLREQMKCHARAWQGQSLVAYNWYAKLWKLWAENYYGNCQKVVR